MKEALLCQICNEGHLHLDETTSTLKTSHGELAVLRHFHWCDTCGTEVALDDDVRFNARMARRVEQQARGKLTGLDIRALRKNLGINQELAGRVFGGGPVAFSKYENDDLAPTEAMDNLLWLVSKHPSLAAELAERHGCALPRGYKSAKKEVFIFEVDGAISKIDMTTSQEIFHSITSALVTSQKNWAHGALLSNRRFEAANQHSITIKEYA